jgi:hypothetical protein
MMQALTMTFAEKCYMAYMNSNIVSSKVNQGL